MVKIKITEINEAGQEQKEKIENWEIECFEIGLKVAREEAEKRLARLEEELHKRHPSHWENKGWIERTIMTVFGTVKLRRRIYKDEENNYHILLDEALGLTEQVRCSNHLQKEVVSLASLVTFREASRILSALTGARLSKDTIHRMVKRVAERGMEEEKKELEACLERGEACQSEGKVVDYLYTEADGIFVHLQREDQKWYEIKNAIAYEGWERLPQQAERYGLIEKQIYCHGDPQIDFWEGASLEWSRKWDLSQVKKVVISGDGASWIDEGVEWFPNAVLQRDGFHLAKNIRKAFFWNVGEDIYLNIRNGETEKALELISQKERKKTKEANKALTYILKQMNYGVDWRNQVGESPLNARSLGTMESQEDSIIADRMKNRGMSWTIEGAQRMAKIIQFSRNGKLERFCRRAWGKKPIIIPQVSSRSKGVKDHDVTFDEIGNLPILSGPEADSPCAQTLRQMSINDFPVT